MAPHPPTENAKAKAGRPAKKNHRSKYGTRCNRCAKHFSKSRKHFCCGVCRGCYYRERPARMSSRGDVRQQNASALKRRRPGPKLPELRDKLKYRTAVLFIVALGCGPGMMGSQFVGVHEKMKTAVGVDKDPACKETYSMNTGGKFMEYELGVDRATMPYAHHTQVQYLEKLKEAAMAFLLKLQKDYKIPRYARARPCVLLARERGRRARKRSASYRSSSKRRCPAWTTRPRRGVLAISRGFATCSCL